jgi:hypothetical protein
MNKVAAQNDQDRTIYPGKSAPKKFISYWGIYEWISIVVL